MRTALRLALAGAVVAGLAATAAPAAANDCSDPKRPCQPCYLNPEARDVRELVRCYPV